MVGGWVLAGLLAGAFSLGVFLGLALAVLCLNRHAFREHAAEIARRNAELDAHIKGGCRQKIDLPHDLEG